LPFELASFSEENEYGITLISLDEMFRQNMEPHSATYRERIESLSALHNAGCKTWVSIEPYPTPNIIEQDLSEILEEVSFCDKIIFGRLHYNKQVTAYKKHKEFFNTLSQQVIDFCTSHNISYHIKTRTITK